MTSTWTAKSENKPCERLVSAHLANVLDWMLKNAPEASCGQTGQSQPLMETQIEVVEAVAA